jgi:hypothetical protein
MLPNRVNAKSPTATFAYGFVGEASWNQNGANVFNCEARDASAWKRDCGPGQVYCGLTCPTYDGQPAKQFNLFDDGRQMCLTNDHWDTGSPLFPRNELVNNNIPDLLRPAAPSIRMIGR